MIRDIANSLPETVSKQPTFTVAEPNNPALSVLSRDLQHLSSPLESSLSLIISNTPDIMPSNNYKVYIS